MRGDLAALVAGFGEALHDAGLPVGPDRGERFARAVTLLGPQSTDELHRIARATLTCRPEQFEILDRVFDAIFRGYVDPAGAARGDLNAPGASTTTQPGGGAPAVSDRPSSRDAEREIEAPVSTVGSAAERLASRDFATLSAEELALLADLMRRLAVATPPRRSRRPRRTPSGRAIDLRTTLRRARTTGGHPLRLLRREPRTKPRRLVVLCDISGSMEPYARAMLQLLYCAAATSRAEVFTFATRLTRLTRVLARTRPAVALERAGRAAPDWSGGTRIGAALKCFTDDYGRRGLARGAVVLIVSDGWETGDPAQVGREMARLARLAYRIVWVNPRTQSPRYQPLVGGMAAAWPHCDAVVSAHSLAALQPLLDALQGSAPPCCSPMSSSFPARSTRPGRCSPTSSGSRPACPARS
ncbi:VWA domain-containing protein [Dactylosporangium roseum]|uniref:VWA domain-containing protein n=1 Tax=Dactylosporangium roseum TaxID=47989 RepID=A0ABY5Z392_9ACTN|nr:VWA domain-containing protein [Dactylosporangium roseum]UWZ36272.1 VWA domain-containing protein [Dactylosporangium roseum]